MTDYLLIDANSIGFAAQSMRKLHMNEMETQAIFGVIRSVRLLCDENPKAKPIIFWDGRSWRYGPLPSYKDGREKDPKAAAERNTYKEQRPYISRALNALGVEQHMAANQEADDLIARMAWELPSNLKATVVSGDRDLLQLVKENVDWLNPIRLPGGRTPKLLRVTHESFAEDTGYEDASSFVKGKSFLGDSSDNIIGVDGIGAKSAPMVVKTWPNIKDMIEDITLRGDAAIPASLSRYKKKLKDFAASKEAQRRYLTNFKLMRLTDTFIPEPVNYQISKPEFQPEAFKLLCQELGFVSIMKDFDGWTRVFAERSA